MKIIRSEKDIENLEVGEAYEFEYELFADDPEGPLKALETPEYKRSLELEALVNEKFTPKEPKDPLVIERMDEDTLMVTVNEGLPAVIDGDARKKTIKTDNPTKVGLQKTREGFITVNDEKVEYPDA